MPEVRAEFGVPWASGGSVYQAALDLPWRTGGSVYGPAGSFTPGSGSGGAPISPTPLVPAYTIAGAQAYLVQTAVSLVDERTSETLELTGLSISTDVDSMFWQLRAQGGGSVYTALTSGAQPATLLLTVGSATWRFVVDTISRTRSISGAEVSLQARSLTAAAGAPYQAEQVWLNDGATTAAQIAAVSNLYSGLSVVWGLEDWLIPDRVWSFQGTPLAAVKRLAEAVGAVVESDPVKYEVLVRPRYPLLPNEWPVSAPDVLIALDAVITESFERADQPAYNGVYVSGLQQGALGYVTLAGTNGASLHPLVTDVLLTEEPALRMRGMAVLGGSGRQARVALRLPVLGGSGQPGVLRLGQICKVLDGSTAWFGMVVSVAVDCGFPTVRQTVVLDRRTELLAGTTAADSALNPLLFSGPVPAQTATVGAAFNLALAPFWSGGQSPYGWSMRSGVLPAGLTLNAATGVVSGTPTAAGVSSGVAFRAVDAIANMADSNAITFTVS